MRTDLLIIGAGPSGIFTAYELLQNGDRRSILIAEQGYPVEKRRCPKTDTGLCAHCEPCNIMAGFSGAGAFSDGKLSLSYEVGGDLPQLVGEGLIEKTIPYTDRIYLAFGADAHVEGVDQPERIKEIRRRAIASGLKLVDCPIRHLGTEKTREIYFMLQQHLLDRGVQILFRAKATELIVKDGECMGAILSTPTGEVEVYAGNTIVAAGRLGAGWLDEQCRKHAIAHEAGNVDIGVRVEVRNEIMDEINELLYESKLIGYPLPFKNKVRTFCQNPGGYVVQENYDEGLVLVNGHSFKGHKSGNTNVAILCTHHFTVPFDQPIAYAQMVGKMVNMLANGTILVQRYGDILEGKRTWAHELSRSNIIPTLTDAVAGDISAAFPYRTLTNILNFIQAVDRVVPGFASPETLLYAPEIKFYSNRVSMDKQFNTNIKHLHCLGDASGWTRGLMMSSTMGVLMARNILSSEAKLKAI
jgi:uncharacterized FAD-dependent dehydrogenase